MGWADEHLHQFSIRGRQYGAVHEDVLQFSTVANDPQPAIAVMQLRMALRGLSPPVWRRVLIPEHITLARLHEVIQAAMGWTDDHLHQSIIRGRRYGEAREGARCHAAWREPGLVRRKISEGWNDIWSLEKGGTTGVHGVARVLM